MQKPEKITDIPKDNINVDLFIMFLKKKKAIVGNSINCIAGSLLYQKEMYLLITAQKRMMGAELDWIKKMALDGNSPLRLHNRDSSTSKLLKGLQRKLSKGDTKLVNKHMKRF